jgi:hypothetical protein
MGGARVSPWCDCKSLLHKHLRHSPKWTRTTNLAVNSRPRCDRIDPVKIGYLAAVYPFVRGVRIGYTRGRMSLPVPRMASAAFPGPKSHPSPLRPAEAARACEGHNG